MGSPRLPPGAQLDAPARPAGVPQALIADGLRERAGVRYAPLGVGRVLRRSDPPLPDCWSIDPYRGCSFGCRYCSARDREGAEPADFARRVVVQRGAPEALRAQLAGLDLAGRPLVIGTLTDPYQPAEGRYRLTRGILEVLAASPSVRGLDIELATRSTLVVRDVDVLQQLATHALLSVHVALITLDSVLCRKLEPDAPTPARRLATVRVLAAAGVRVGVDAIPILPDLNDAPDDLRALFRSAAQSGAHWVGVAPLVLSPAGRQRFLRWLRHRLPEQLPAYRRRFAQGRDTDRTWLTHLRTTIRKLRKETGLPPHPSPRSLSRAAMSSPTQLTLPGISPRAA